jgi:hypothetical protein
MADILAAVALQSVALLLAVLVPVVRVLLE